MDLNIYALIVAFIFFMPIYLNWEDILTRIRAIGISFYVMGIGFLLLSVVILFVLESVTIHLLWRVIFQGIFLFFVVTGGVFLKKGTWEHLETNLRNNKPNDE